MQTQVPIITIDGPSGSGKGTLAFRLAGELGWGYLDSGVLYRALGLMAVEQGIAPTDVPALATLAQDLPVRFAVQADHVEILLADQVVTQAVRTEKAGEMASKVSQHAEVRTALMALQHHFAKAPGLVTDGRDMGTVVFPEAPLKLFLTASPEIRAKRRLKQLQAMGVDATLAGLVEELTNRDQRDQERAVSPLKPASDAHVIDTSDCSSDQVFQQVMAQVADKGWLA